MSIVKDMFLAGALGGGGGGGGGSDYTLLASKEYEVSTTSTSETTVDTLNVPGSYTKDFIIYVKVRDKAGKRAGYCTGIDQFFINNYAANGATGTISTYGKITSYVSSSGFNNTGQAYGVYVYSISSAGDISIRAKYSSSYGTIDGTYVVEVYALKWPNDDSPFA